MPRDCTALRLQHDVQSRVKAAGSNTMPLKTKQKKSKQNMSTAKQKTQPKPTPFGDRGAEIGNALGSLYGLSGVGKTVGRWLGTGIGSIFGSGDYTMIGSQPKYNILGNAGQIPKFDTTHATNIICHREYLGDISGTSAFNVLNYPLQPGNSTTFPWLATIAQNYQQYKFHGVVFEFRSLLTDFVTNGQPGVVVLATNYNASQSVFVNKQQMENSEFAVSTKPTVNLMHMIECDPNITIDPIKFVRTGPVPSGQDARLYDWGNFQFATQSNPSGNPNLGELWVTYCVEFLKPVIPPTLASVNNPMYHFVTSGVASGNILGTTPVSASGSLAGVSKTGNVLNFNGVANALYEITIVISSANTAGGFTITPSLTNCTAYNLLGNGVSGAATTVSSITTSYGQREAFVLVVKCILNGATSISFADTLSLTGFAVADITIVTLDAAITV